MIVNDLNVKPDECFSIMGISKEGKGKIFYKFKVLKGALKLAGWSSKTKVAWCTVYTRPDSNNRIVQCHSDWRPYVDAFLTTVDEHIAFHRAKAA